MKTEHTIDLKAVGSNDYNNLQVLHKHCHDVKTKADLTAIKRHKVRQEWNKANLKIQKQFDNSEWKWIEDLPTLV